MPGLIRGTTMRQYRPHSVMPSMRADSSISAGRLAMYCLSRNTAKKLMEGGTASTKYVSVRPIRENELKIGMIVTSWGMLTDPSAVQNSNRFVLNSYLAKAKPAMEERKM